MHQRIQKQDVELQCVRYAVFAMQHFLQCENRMQSCQGLGQSCICNNRSASSRREFQHAYQSFDQAKTKVGQPRAWGGTYENSQIGLTTGLGSQRLNLTQLLGPGLINHL